MNVINQINKEKIITIIFKYSKIKWLINSRVASQKNYWKYQLKSHMTRRQQKEEKKSTARATAKTNECFLPHPLS